MDSPKRKKSAKKTKQQEKRAKRYRSTCPAKLYERIQRAATQRLYLVQQSEIPEEDAADLSIQFTVLGSTGNVYTVTLGLVPSCDCPDFCRHEDLCKHILFVLLKVIGLSTSNPLAFQKAYISTELKELFGLLRNRRVGGSVLANAQVRAAVAGKTVGATDEEENTSGGVHRRSLEQDSDCPICFDELTATCNLTYCRAACGVNFHKDCIRRFFAQPSSDRSCPTCRQPWIEESAAKQGSGNSSNEGYANYGSLQGLSPDRDTSTYYQGGGYYGSHYKRRRRR